MAYVWVREQIDIVLDEFASFIGGWGKVLGRSVFIKGFLQGSLLLLIIALIDSKLGAPASFRLAYLWPAWMAADRSGRRAGIVVAILTAIAYTVIGQNHSVGNLIFAFATLSGMVMLLDRKRKMLASTLELAHRDPLTGAANRLAFEHFVRAAVDNAAAQGDDVAIAVVDCDKFKTLNDVHGHAHGDEILKVLVKVLQKTVPNSGMVGRIGGDEFVIVAPRRQAAYLEHVLAKASDRFADATFVMGTPMAFSYGIASFPDAGANVEALFEAADSDMYRRKVMKTSPDGLFDSALA